MARPLRANPRTVTLRPASVPARTPSAVSRSSSTTWLMPVTYLGIEATNRVTPSMPASAPTIQKRIVTFSSFHPPSSKW